MGITEDIFNVVQAPRAAVVIAVSRKRRIQLEYKLQTTIVGMFVKRARNGTKYTLPNKSVIIVQVAGPEKPDVDTMEMKAKEWNAWLNDVKEEEDAKKS